MVMTGPEEEEEPEPEEDGLDPRLAKVLSDSVDRLETQIGLLETFKNISTASALDRRQAPAHIGLRSIKGDAPMAITNELAAAERRLAKDDQLPR